MTTCLPAAAPCGALLSCALSRATLSRAALLWVALLCIGLVHVPAAQAQRAQGAWTSRCEPSHCSASVRVRSDEPGVPYAWQLRVSRHADARIEVVLLTGSLRPADDAEIATQVDGKPSMTLAPDSGYRRIGRSNTFVVAGAHTDALLSAMRGGRQLALAFRTPAGAQARAIIPLAGLDAALAKIGVNAPAPAMAIRQKAAQEKAAVPDAHAGAAPGARPAADSTRKQPAPAAPQASAAAKTPASSSAAAGAPPRQHPESTHPAADSELPAAVLDGPDAPPPAAAPGRAVQDSVSVPRQFACQGNEPFWNLMIDGDNARFVSLSGSGDAQPVLLTGRLQGTAEGSGATFGWRGRSADGNSYGALIERRACRDSMSDREGVTAYPYAATVAAPGGRTLQGCCNTGLSLDRRAGTVGEPTVNLAGLRGRAPEDWSRHLPDMLRALQVCLERTPGEGAYVTKAWPMNRGLVGVRTRNASVGWFECIAAQDGRTVDSFVPVDSQAARIADEERLLFVPASGAPQAGNCFRHEQVLDDAGRALGWLTANGCWRAPAPPVARRK